MDSYPDLDRIKQMMRDRGAHKIVFKRLSPNDNSKNQIYLGEGFGAANILPTGQPVAAVSGGHRNPIFKAAVKLCWMDNAGQIFPAPYSQLILYPQYPEVRLSGFLRSSEWAPNDLMTSRREGRVLLFGLAADQTVIAYAAEPDSPVAKEILARSDGSRTGVFEHLPVDQSDYAYGTQESLLKALCLVHRKGWIKPWRLQASGDSEPCKGSNCAGVTLESELGILSNSERTPDFEGWEVKSYIVTSFDSKASKALTLMTPEPTGGHYKTEGIESFIRKYGYKDKRGRPNRHNFGGIHCVGKYQPTTGLTMRLTGYDLINRKITSSDGELALIDKNDSVAASWSLSKLLSHWQVKHLKAAYVPAIQSDGTDRQYHYGINVMLGVGTDYLQFLNGLISGNVYLDPAIKVVDTSNRLETKRRNQFRIKLNNLATLYHKSTRHQSCE